MSSQSEPSKEHTLLKLLGAGGLMALLSIAVMMGRYAQIVDHVAADVQTIKNTAFDNQKTLAGITQEQAIQKQVADLTESRIDRLEAKNNAN